MKTTEKIQTLRKLMKQEGVDGYLIPSSDPHMSEYLPECYKIRSWFSGFNGSAGTLVITEKEAALWTDGRYFVQAERQLKGSGIVLMRMGEPGVPEIEEWLSEQLPEEGTMGIHGMITSMKTIRQLEIAFEQKSITIKDVDLITPIWKERPTLPHTSAWILEKKYAGKSPSEKILQLREKLKKEQADGMLISRLDDTAWLFNLRADDIEYNPFAMCFGLILPDCVYLFIEKSRLADGAEAFLKSEGIEVLSYNQITETISGMSKNVTVLYEASGSSYTLYEAMRENPAITVKEAEDPIQLMKSIKNETELESIRKAHIKDGIAMVRFAMELEEKIETDITIRETDVEEMIHRHHMAQENCMGESFATIAAYGTNAAMMHYHPTQEQQDFLEKKGFLLLDCGAQYLDGTTDITRTYALGTPTEEEKDYYTLVLRAHIRMAKLVFKEGTPGRNLDVTARELFWERGLDYRCGTGHGVGFVGVIHEGPQNINQRNTVPFEAGMIVTDEPGIYEEGKIGIRIENELICKEAFETEYGKFLRFEPITYCPIDKKGIAVQKLQEEELEWLNMYHAMVEETLSPYLDEKERLWLKNACAPIGK